VSARRPRGRRASGPQEASTTRASGGDDALGRRIKKAERDPCGSVQANGGDLDGTTYFYYNAKWQLLETRAGEPRTLVRADG